MWIGLRDLPSDGFQSVPPSNWKQSSKNRRLPLTDRSMRELQRSEKELRDFVEHAAVAQHWVAGDGTIIWANDAQLRLLGYCREEYVGHNIAEFHADEPVIRDILQRL